MNNRKTIKILWVEDRPEDVEIWPRSCERLWILPAKNRVMLMAHQRFS